MMGGAPTTGFEAQSGAPTTGGRRPYDRCKI